LPYVEQAARLFARLAESFAQDPIGGVAKLVAAKAALDLAMNGVAKAGEKLSGAIGDAATKVAAKIPGAGGHDVAGAVGMGAALGISAATVILSAGIVNFERREADIKATGSELTGVREAAKTGDVETARKLRESAEARLAESKKGGVAEGMLSAGIDVASMVNLPALAARAFGAKVDSEGAARAITGATVDQNREVAIKSQEAMVAEMRKLELAAEKAAAALARLDSAAPNRGNAPSAPVVK
jgi:hypothetical protein